jgi:hypothetical protein
MRGHAIAVAQIAVGVLCGWLLVQLAQHVTTL